MRKNALNIAVSPTHTTLKAQVWGKWKVCSDSLSNWFSSATFVNEKQRQESGVSASFTITLIKNLLGMLPKTSAENISQAPFKEDASFHCLWRDPSRSSDRAEHYQRLEQHHQMSQRCCITEASCLFMNFPSCCAYLLLFPPQEGKHREKNLWLDAVVQPEDILCLLVLDFVAINHNRWGRDAEITQCGD